MGTAAAAANGAAAAADGPALAMGVGTGSAAGKAAATTTAVAGVEAGAAGEGAAAAAAAAAGVGAGAGALVCAGSSVTRSARSAYISVRLLCLLTHTGEKDECKNQCGCAPQSGNTDQRSGRLMQGHVFVGVLSLHRSIVALGRGSIALQALLERHQRVRPWTVRGQRRARRTNKS
jgi:hypothetical protein